jgi:hypothetical protein
MTLPLSVKISNRLELFLAQKKLFELDFLRAGAKCETEYFDNTEFPFELFCFGGRVVDGHYFMFTKGYGKTIFKDFYERLSSND